MLKKTYISFLTTYTVVVNLIRRSLKFFCIKKMTLILETYGKQDLFYGIQTQS